MRLRPFPVVAHVVACALLTACADVASAPTAPAPLSPRAATRDLLSLTSATGDTVIGGATFAKVESRPGGWMETFNVYAFPDVGSPSPWTKPPAAWVPQMMTSSDVIASNFLRANDATTTSNSLPLWAIAKQVRERANWYTPEPMLAWHDGMTCAAPPATHAVASYDEAPFLCRNHMMTAVNSSGYAVTYLTPPRLLQFSGVNNAVVRFDVATLRTSSRDWIDLWITPYDDNLVVPLDDSLPDAQGHPANALHVRMSGTQSATRFEAAWIVDHRAYRITPATTTTYEQAFTAYAQQDPSHSGAPSATRRDTFELRLSLGRLKFGMPRYDLWWIDVPALTLNVGTSGLGVVQLGHHSFAPATGGGSADTWHWDNIGLAPSVAFSIVNANRRYVDQSSTPTVLLARAAPFGSRLRFAGYGSKFEVRFNGAGSWQSARLQDEQHDVDGRFHSYWTSVPTGTTRIDFRAANDPADRKSPTPIWMARDISVWSLSP